jgi:YggT family protein
MVSQDPYNPIVRFIHNVTSRFFIPSKKASVVFGGMDLSPIIVFLIIIFLRKFLFDSLTRLAISFVIQK